MAYVDQSAMERSTGRTGLRAMRRKIAHLFETPFDRRYRLRKEAIATLQAKSDADLAAMGLLREDIVSHVFAAGYSFER